MPSNSTPRFPTRLSQPWLVACATLTRPWLIWSSPDVPGRLAKALLDLADRFGRPQPLVCSEVALTQEELAQLVGASRETVNKALAEFVSAAGFVWKHAPWSSSTCPPAPAFR